MTKSTNLTINRRSALVGGVTLAAAPAFIGKAKAAAKRKKR